tara:strand:+ start:502 stop:1110 length:609 start_codon:yes stop_codon:yes gene_type:complete
MKNDKILILNTGYGNINSIKNMLDFLNIDNKVTDNYLLINDFNKIILPGIGNFQKGIDLIKKKNFFDAIIKAHNEKKIILGICLGMQMFFEYSEESKDPGFGFIKGKIKKFKNLNLKVPHMGWNEVKYKNNDFILLNSQSPRYYFMHSYYAVCDNKEDILSVSKYDLEFVSGIKKNNLIGVQFHPEKSHKFGMEFYKIFSEI